MEDNYRIIYRVMYMSIPFKIIMYENHKDI